jgi:hypothetical protein
LRIIRRTIGSKTYVIISELDADYHAAAQDLYYSQIEDGFAKVYPANTPHLDRIYQNFEHYAEEMILQMAGVHPVPWEQGLLVFLQIIEGQNIDWWLTGSAALAVRGLDVSPRDLDLVVDDSGAQKLGDLMLDYLIEPVIDTHGWFCKWFGRAFLHARIEWMGDVSEKADEPEISDFGPTAASRLESINWREHEIRVPPLDLQLRVNERRGLTDRVEKIEHAMNRHVR